MPKSFLILLLVFSCFKLTAQKNPVLYAGLDLYRHTGFENNTFGNFHIGAQLYHWKFLAPEVGFDHYTGSLETRNIYKGAPGNSVRTAIFDQSFGTSLLTLNPKIKLGKEDAYLTFSPSYHIGRVYGKGTYFLPNERGRFVPEESQRTGAAISFWSFSIGVEGLAIQADKYWFSLSLNYTEISVNEAFSKLDFSEKDINADGISTTTIGLGLRIYYNPFPVEND